MLLMPGRVTHCHSISTSILTHKAGQSFYQKAHSSDVAWLTSQRSGNREDTLARAGAASGSPCV
jgi:hypothetical protein